MFKQKLGIASLLAVLVSTLGFHSHIAQAQLVLVRDITFPVIGATNFSNDFGAPRSGGRTHEGNDIMGKKLMPLIAAVDGTITNVNYPEATWGYSVTIRDKDGYQYWYLHMNNDHPGTDDGKGDGFFAYAPDIQEGNPVVKGQLIGWMGDSGNAESTAPHLHFEIHDPSGTAFDPYLSLKSATHIPVPIATYPALPGEVLPYENFGGGMHVASGNFDVDSNPEVVTGAMAGGGPLVKVLEKDGTVKTSFYAYDPGFRGGVDVAAADIDGDGTSEIITAPGFGGGPHVRVFKADGSLFKEFMAYDPNFHGGVNVAATDLDSDGKAEIITGPGQGGGPDVRVFSLAGAVPQKTNEFMAYDPGFHGGVDVSALPKTIITGPQEGGGPHVKIFDASGTLTGQFMAYDPTFHGGVRVSGVATTSSVVTMPASGGGPNLKTFSLTGTETNSSMAGFEVWWRGGYDVTGASDGTIFVSSGPGRRTSFRPSTFNTNSGNGGGGHSHFPAPVGD